MPADFTHTYQQDARVKSAARSAIIVVGELVFPDTKAGSTEQSATRSPSIPLTRNSRSTTAVCVGPIQHVPAGRKIVRACSRIASSSLFKPSCELMSGPGQTSSPIISLNSVAQTSCAPDALPFSMRPDSRSDSRGRNDHRRKLASR